MLTSAAVATALPAQDLDRARRFYSEKLGLEPVETMREGASLRYDVADGAFVLFVSAGRPSGAHTQMGFLVEDVESEASALRARGVVFEDIPGLEQKDGIATLGSGRGAWFKDSEGNLLSVFQEGAT